MPIVTRTLVPKILFEHVIEGELIARDILTLLNAFWAGRRNLGDEVHTLWDLRRADLRAVTYFQIQELAEAVRRQGPAMKPGRTSILIGVGFEQMLGEMFGKELASSFPRGVRVFRDHAAALTYLQEDRG